jgi:hypothetical protein
MPCGLIFNRFARAWLNSIRKMTRAWVFFFNHPVLGSQVMMLVAPFGFCWALWDFFY